MGFDAQAFATAFLEGQATDIKERVKEARVEGERKKEIARTAGMSQYRKRKALASKYLGWANSLAEKDMTKENVSFLIGDPSSLATVWDEVNKFEQQHGKPMDANKLNQLIELTNDYAPPINEETGEILSFKDQIQRTSGLYRQNYTDDLEKDDDNMLY